LNQIQFLKEDLDIRTVEHASVERLHCQLHGIETVNSKVNEGGIPHLFHTPD
jgi:hypothetical protein